MAKAKAKKKAPAKTKAPAKKAAKKPAKKPVKKATKKAAKKPARKAAVKEVLLVGSKVKATIKEANCNTGGDAIDGLNGWVHWLIQQGTKRAVANGRKTVRAHDFLIM